MNLANFRSEVRDLLQTRQAPGRARSSAPPSVAEQLESSIKQLIVDGEILKRGGKLVGVISLSDIARYVEPIGAAETMKKVSEREARVT